MSFSDDGLDMKLTILAAAFIVYGFDGFPACDDDSSLNLFCRAVQ
jgi:hypothetical protein